MLIILEGVDCSGKTTLANELAQIIEVEHTSEIIHRGVPVEHVLDEYELALIDYSPENGHSIVCDRWHVGPDVYGPIKRKDAGLDPVIKWHIESYLIGKGGLLVYTEMPLPGLLARMEERGEDYLARDEVEEVIDLYRSTVSDTRLTKMYSLEGVHSPITVVSMARAAEQAAAQSGKFRSYVGPRRPTNLFVGDSDTEIAYMPYETSYAYNIIKEYGLNSRVPAGFVNFDEDLGRLWDALYNPIVYAFDTAGAEACTNANVPFSLLKDGVLK